MAEARSERRSAPPRAGAYGTEGTEMGLSAQVRTRDGWAVSARGRHRDRHDRAAGAAGRRPTRTGSCADATSLAPGAVHRDRHGRRLRPHRGQRDRHGERAGRGRDGHAGPAGRHRAAAAGAVDRRPGPLLRRRRSPSTWASPACTAGSPSSPARSRSRRTSLAKSRVEAVIRAASIDTGNGMRDDHLRSADFLDVEAFPEITYRSTGLTAGAGTDRWTVHGELTHARRRTRPSTSTSPTSAPAPTRGAARGRRSARRRSCGARTSR